MKCVSQRGFSSLLGLLFILALIWGGYALYQGNQGEGIDPLALFTQDGEVETPDDEGCFVVTSHSGGDTVSFPATFSGKIDNLKEGCNWIKFEGQGGVAELYFHDDDLGWNPLGTPTPIMVDEWMSDVTDFSVELTFNNAGIGLPKGTELKVVFTEEDPSGKGETESIELLVTFDDAPVVVKPVVPAPEIEKPKEDGGTELLALEKEILSLISVEANRFSQCKVIPIGHRECGGPDGYLLYSTKDIDEDKFMKLVEDYTTLDKALEKDSGLSSICAIEEEPSVALEGGECVEVE